MFHADIEAGIIVCFSNCRVTVDAARQGRARHRGRAFGFVEGFGAPFREAQTAASPRTYHFIPFGAILSQTYAYAPRLVLSR